jgi:hypothetical protein
MKGFQFWQRWLFVVGLVVALFGGAMALLNGTALFDVFNRQIDPVFWAAETMPGAARSFRSWLYGAWGATVAGWGVLIVFIARYPFKRRELWSWNCLVVGLVVWYVLDTGISLYFKVYFNALFNTVLLALVTLPLGATRSQFSPNAASEARNGT